MAVDVFPGVGVDEGQLIGGDTYYVAVDLVELVASVGELAGEDIVNIGEACGSVRFGAGVGCEGVEIDVVYEIVRCVEDSLMSIKQYTVPHNYLALTY